MGDRQRDGRYVPIRDYAAIGDCHGAALVARDGGIDWCALRRFDAEPVFCRILDAGKGGFWSIRPTGRHTAEQSYLGETNIVGTVFDAPGGQVRLTDFMPVGRQLDTSVHDYVTLNAPGWLIRRLEGVAGEVEVEIRYRPSRCFASGPAALGWNGEAVVGGPDVPMLFSPLAFDLEGDLARATVRVGAGERIDFVLTSHTVQGRSPLDRVEEFHDVTRCFWLEWLEYCRYDGRHALAVRRSALALKLLTFAPSGAVVAAPTTSLPEELGGARNWDYRFSWLRDSCFTLYALAVLGYSGEARRYNHFLGRCIHDTLPNVQIMYGIYREHRLDELELHHLEGYAGSRPVRIGNSAYLQRQIDVYGQVLDLALLYQRVGGALGEQYRRLLRTLAEFIERHWDEPDQGIWEMRGPPRHHVHGKLMSWVAAERASRLFDDADHWRELAARIEAAIKRDGIDPEGGYYRQAFDGGTDAAVLLAPLLGFPARREVMQATVRHVRERLGRGDYLLRYDAPDGIEGQEGAFLICSFWLVDALLATGEVDDAERLLDRLLGCANHVGLYPEEIDPASGAFLGNFPQALTHLALIGSACNLELVRNHGPKVLYGSYADRAGRSVGATLGWRGVLAAMRQSGRLVRLRSSGRSKLAWP